MKKAVTFGELMLRLAPKSYLRFVHSEKHSVEGKYSLVSVAEAKSLAGGDASGRVQR